MNTSKTFKLYYQGNCQNLIVYQGIPQNEIKQAIMDVLKIPSNETINILDGSGTPVVMSSYLPNDIQLFIEIQRSFTDNFIIQQQNLNNTNSLNDNEIEWKWNTPSNESHKLKNDNKTVYQPNNLSQAYCFGNLVMNRGTYYFTLIFDPLWCCCMAGIEPVSGDSNNYSVNTMSGRDQVCSTFLTNVNFYELFKNANEDRCKGVIEAGFFVDMTKSLFIITDHKNKNIVGKFNFNEDWKTVVPVVLFKHVMSITISQKATTVKPSWIDSF